MRWGGALLQRLQAEDAKNTFIRPPDGPDRPWLLRVKLSELLQKRFALAPEVLILAIPDGKKIESRDLDRARDEIITAGVRLDSDLLIVVDRWPNLFDRLRRLHRSGQWIPWQPDEKSGRFVFPSLSEQLRRHLPEYDAFEARDPVRGHQVIGRKDVIRDVSKRLEAGQSIGVFGLRKVGKTTLVRAVTDALDPVSAALSISGFGAQRSQIEMDEPSRVLAVWLDCQGIIRRTREGLSELLCRELMRRLSAAGASPETDVAEPFERLAAILDFVSRSDLPPLCIVLDEYDLLFESSEDWPAIAGVEQVFGLFRAVAQMTAKLSLAVIGRDPEFFQRPKMNGIPNPMLGWFTEQWVGPLNKAGADELLSTLGRRVGLDVGKQTKDLAFRWTGGHPLLHRQYGSVLLSLAQQSSHGKDSVPTDPLCKEAVEPFLERSFVTEICREVYDLLSIRYPGAEALLDDLARSGADAPAALARHGGFRAPPARVLRSFGLLSGTPDHPSLFELFRWYTVANRPHRAGEAP